jgi:hypothetical protein
MSRLVNNTTRAIPEAAPRRGILHLDAEVADISSPLMGLSLPYAPDAGRASNRRGGGIR